jgi:hypothetical protein
VRVTRCCLGGGGWWSVKCHMGSTIPLNAAHPHVWGHVVCDEQVWRLASWGLILKFTFYEIWSICGGPRVWTCVDVCGGAS